MSLHRSVRHDSQRQFSEALVSALLLIVDLAHRVGQSDPNALCNLAGDADGVAAHHEGLALEVLRAQLHAIGPDYDERRAAAFGGLLALGRVDVFAGEKDDREGESLGIDLVEQFKDYGPVLELAAERWEELETATGGSAASRLSRLKDEPARFWKAFAPYLNRSTRLRSRNDSSNTVSRSPWCSRRPG